MTCKSCEVKKEDTSIVQQFEEWEKMFSFPKIWKVVVAKSLDEAIAKLSWKFEEKVEEKTENKDEEIVEESEEKQEEK